MDGEAFGWLHQANTDCAYVVQILKPLGFALRLPRRSKPVAPDAFRGLQRDVEGSPSKVGTVSRASRLNITATK